MKTILAFAFLIPFTANAALKNPAGSGTVEFLAVGRPSMLKIRGEAKGPSAALEIAGTQLKGAVDFEMSKLGTGISLRDQHMKEKYLQVKDHPTAKLTLVDVPVDAGFEKTLTNSGEKPFQGKLSLHGKEKDVAGTYTAKDGVVQAKFPVTLTDYAIDVPSYLGITVAEKVDVTVELPLKKE